MTDGKKSRISSGASKKLEKIAKAREVLDFYEKFVRTNLERELNEQERMTTANLNDDDLMRYVRATRMTFDASVDMSVAYLSGGRTRQVVLHESQLFQGVSTPEMAETRAEQRRRRDAEVGEIEKLDDEAVNDVHRIYEQIDGLRSKDEIAETIGKLSDEQLINAARFMLGKHALYNMVKAPDADQVNDQHMMSENVK